MCCGLYFIKIMRQLEYNSLPPSLFHSLSLSLSLSLSPQYEYKVKGCRKKRCYIEMSVSGVKISRRKSKRVSPVKLRTLLTHSNTSLPNNPPLMKLRPVVCVCLRVCPQLSLRPGTGPFRPPSNFPFTYVVLTGSGGRDCTNFIVCLAHHKTLKLSFS